MLADVRGLTRGALDVLELLAVLCGIVLFGIAAFSLLLATIRVAIRGRVFALPFTGNDNRRVELANLFIRRLSTMEEEWIELAQEIEAVRTDINARAEAYDEVSAVAPLTSKGKLPPLQAPSEQFIAVTATRTTGDELLYQVVQLGGIDSIGSADLGVVSLAGVSFSPRDILALLRAAPGILARRTLRGSIITTVGGNLLTVEFEERGPIAGRRRRTETAEVKADAWRAAIEDLAYRIERERVYLVRDRPSWRRRFVAVQDDARSQTVRQGLIEAESWVACRSFLVAYAAHLKHYRDGSAAEREEALRSYDEALASQPRFPRAAYNRAVLLYNRFLPIANDQAIEGFELATTTRDPSLMPLALSGLAMAHCQAIQRFHRNRDDHQQAARSAANAAFALAPQLVEAAFAQGWIQQLDGKWHDAITQYRAVVTLPGATAVERRIKSFALNNAAWITLHKLAPKQNALAEAEKLLWQALNLYPNKVAYANLAEIARRCERYDDAIDLYKVALALDPDYTNALNELAIVEKELATRETRAGHYDKAQDLLTSAHEYANAAQQLAQEDPAFAAGLKDDFNAAEATAVDLRRMTDRPRAQLAHALVTLAAWTHPQHAARRNEGR